MFRKKPKKITVPIAASSVTNRIVAYTVVTSGLCVGSVFVLSKTSASPIIVNLFILSITGSADYLAVLLFLAFYKGAADTLANLFFRVNSLIRPNKNTQDNLEKPSKPSLTSTQVSESSAKNPDP